MYSVRDIKPGQVHLPVAIRQDHPLAVIPYQDVRQVDGGDGLADAAFVVHNRNRSHVNNSFSFGKYGADRSTMPSIRRL